MRREENRRTQPRIPGQCDLQDYFLDKIKDIIPSSKKKLANQGRSPLDIKLMMNGIFYILRTECQLKMEPKDYGGGSSAHRYYRSWV